MNNKGGRLHFSITADNEDVKRKLAEARQGIINSGKTAEEQGLKIEGMFKRAAGAVAAFGGTIALGATVKSLYDFSNAFDKSMKEVSTISDVVSKNINGFKRQIMELGTKVPIAADAAGKALYQIVSAGYDGAAGMNLLEVSAKSAIAGMTDTTTAADAITTLLNAYKKSASEASSISDQLFMTAKLGKTTFGELGQSISQAAPIAASFGIETEQVLAAVATLTKSGTPTAQAMTQIRASIIAATKVLGDGYFATHTFQEGLQEIANRAGGSESKLRALVPEIEAMNGVLGLTGINAKMAASDLEALGGATGETEKAFMKMNDSADNQLTILKNNMLNKFQTAGNGMRDIVGEMAKFLNNSFDSGAINDVIASVGVLIATLGVYKTQLIVVNALKQAHQGLLYTAHIEELQKLITVKEIDKNADLQKLVANKKLSADQASKIAQLREEANAKLQEMQIDAAKAAAEVRNAKISIQNTGASISASRQKINALRLEQSAAIVGGNAIKANALQEGIYAERKELSALKTSLKTQQTALGTLQDNAGAKAIAANTFQQNINNVSTNAGTKAKTLMSLATGRLTMAFHSLKLAFASNPFGFLLTAITTVISAITLFSNETDKVKGKLSRFNSVSKEAFDGVSSSIEANAGAIDGLIKKYNSLSDISKPNKTQQEELKGVIQEIVTLVPNAASAFDEYNNALGINVTQAEKYIKKQREILAELAGTEATDWISNVKSTSIDLHTKEQERARGQKYSKFWGWAKEEELSPSEKIVLDKEIENLKIKREILFKLLKDTGIEATDLRREITEQFSTGGFYTAPETQERNDALKAFDSYIFDYQMRIQKEEQLRKKQVDGGNAGEPQTVVPMYGTDYSAAQKEWAAAKKELAKIEKDKNAFTREQYNKAVKREADAKTAFDAVGGDRSNNDSLNNANTLKKLAQEKQEKGQFYTDLGFAVRQAEINAMSEGLDKVLAQNDLNYRKEIEQIKRQKEDKLTKIQGWERTIWESQNPNWEKQGKKFKPQTTALSKDDNKQFEVMNNSAFTTLTAGNKKAYETALNEYAGFAVSYIDKANEFEDNLKNLASKHKQERANLISSGASKEAIGQFDQKAKQEVDAVTAVQKELLAELDEQMEVKSQTFILFAEQIANMGIQELKLKLDEAEQLLAQAQTAAGADGDQTSVIEYQAQIRALKQQIVALTKKSDKKEDATSSDALAKHKAALKTVNELGNAAKDIAGAFEGLDGDLYSVIDSIGTMSSSVGSMLSTIELMGTTSQVTIAATTVAAGTGVVAVSTVATTAIKGVEKASVILAIIGAALQIITAIAKTISGVFNGDKKKEKEIKGLQEQVDALGASYKRLGKAIDKAYSADAAALIKEQDANLRKKKALTEEQIRLEESKKKPDHERVNQLKQVIEEIDDELEQTNSRLIEAFVGTDVKSAISEFADAYVDAWAAGEDKAAAMKDVVRKMVKSAVIELVKSRLSPEVTQFMEFLAKAMEDGILTSAEEAALDEFERRIYTKAESIDQNFGKYIKDEDADKREASQKGFTSMSQDSADELNGRFTAMQGMLFDVKEAQLQMLGLQKQNLPQLQHLTHLSAISENTAYCRRLEGIEKDMSSMKNDINTIVLKGITIKK